MHYTCLIFISIIVTEILPGAHWEHFVSGGWGGGGGALQTLIYINFVDQLPTISNLYIYTDK